MSTTISDSNPNESNSKGKTNQPYSESKLHKTAQATKDIASIADSVADTANSGWTIYQIFKKIATEEATKKVAGVVARKTVKTALARTAVVGAVTLTGVAVGTGATAVTTTAGTATLIGTGIAGAGVIGTVGLIALPAVGVGALTYFVSKKLF